MKLLFICWLLLLLIYFILQTFLFCMFHFNIFFTKTLEAGWSINVHVNKRPQNFPNLCRVQIVCYKIYRCWNCVRYRQKCTHHMKTRTSAYLIYFHQFHCPLLFYSIWVWHTSRNGCYAAWVLLYESPCRFPAPTLFSSGHFSCPLDLAHSKMKTFRISFNTQADEGD